MGAILLSGSVVGEGSIVAAGAVVRQGTVILRTPWWQASRRRLRPAQRNRDRAHRANAEAYVKLAAEYSLSSDL